MEVSVAFLKIVSIDYMRDPSQHSLTALDATSAYGNMFQNVSLASRDVSFEDLLVR